MTEPTDLIAPSVLAKSLGVRMQTIYSRVRSGKLDGYGEHPIKVSESEARQLFGDSKGGSRGRRGTTRGPRKTKAKVNEGDIIAVARNDGTANVRGVQRVHKDDDGTPTIIEATGAWYLPDLLQWQMDKGLARRCNIGEVVGLVLQTLVNDDNIEAAASLETWAGQHNIEVVVHEAVEADDEPLD